MMRPRAVLACLLVLVAIVPAGAAYRDCYLGGQYCVTYDWTSGNAYAEGQGFGLTAGAGKHSGSPYEGYEAHLFYGTTYAYAYDGVWLGNDHTLVAVAVGGTEYLWIYQDSRMSEQPGAYHCTKIGTVYSRCGTGLP